MEMGEFIIYFPIAVSLFVALFFLVKWIGSEEDKGND
jgi:hypothetical protein